jgi:inner membrane protein
MVGKTHVVFGLTTLAAANAAARFIQPHPVQEIPTGLVLCMCAVIIGALAPDLDTEEGSQLQFELGEAGLAITQWLQSFGVEHRGLTHYGLSMLVIIAVSALIGWGVGYGDVGLALGLGYLSHLVADSMTIDGIPLWAPFSEKRFHLLPKLLRVRSGGPVEPLVFILAAIPFVFLIPTLIPREIVDLVRHLRS